MWNSDWTTGEAYNVEEKGGGVSVTASASDSNMTFSRSLFDGEKYPGGLSSVNELFGLDYWALRRRSNELFHRNSYARGIIRRLVTNIITTGLYLESIPEEGVIGVKEDSLNDWAEDVETRFFIYGQTPEIVDYKQRRNIGELQRVSKTESLVGGDHLLVLRQHPKFKLPVIQIIPGDRVETPYAKLGDKNVIDGVELDSAGRHIAFYVTDERDPLGYKRISARGRITGRPQAKLIYGCDKREDGVRGVPLLGIAIQPLAEIDRYRDSTQRKALLNSILVSFVERDANFNGQKRGMLGSGANKRSTKVDVVDNNHETHSVAFDDLIPGLNLNYLNKGEKPVLMSNNGVDINFGAFETTIIMGLAWALEIPPEILFLSFNKSFSASKSAVNEFKMFLDKEREKFGADFCDFVYQDWFLSMSLLGKIESGTYMFDYMDASKWDAARAWTMAEWSGQMKPSTDLLATIKAYGEAIDRRLITMSRAIREIFGLKGARVWKQLRKELAIMKELNAINEAPEQQTAEQELGAIAKNIGVASGTSRNIFEMTPDEIAAAKSSADTYGVLVRAGATTPQVDDEDYFRKLFGMKNMSKEVRELWASSGGFRRPITLAQEEAQAAEEIDSGDIGDEDEDEDN